MCGICGILNFNTEKRIDENILHRMCDVIKYRGPDDEGYFLSEKGGGRAYQAGLGARRLSIIDLSTGHQPIANEDRTVVAVCNGEIYNFRQLREGLKARGHRFSTQTDTETIVHLYEEYGYDCVNYLRGMFAFALWDDKKTKLLLARDRLGKKPLVYTVKGNSIIFGSEIKCLLEHPDTGREANLEAVHYFLTYNYIPAPMTGFTGIKKLEPASILICDEKGNIEIRRYWELDYSNKLDLTEEEYKKEILRLLTESVKLRLESDVPLGAFLSGGIDSSAIVAIMSGLSGKPVKTFSIGFQEQSYSELKYARLIAERFGTQHQEFIVKPELLKVLPKLIWHYNEPFSDVSAVPSYYVSLQTRKHVTVALSGDAGDENFAGYDRYVANKLSAYYCRVPGFIRSGMDNLMKNLPEPSGRTSPVRRLKHFLQATSLSEEQRNIKWNCVFDNEMKASIYSDEMNNRFLGNDAYMYMLKAFNQSKGRDFLDRTLNADMLTYLPECLLVKMDIASMANSLEVRSPFLDHKLVEFASRIPSSLKLKGLRTKHILKESLKGLLPPEIIDRPKMGFGVPIGSWFKNELKDYIGEILLSEAALRRGYFKKASVENIINEHISGRVEHGYRLWALLNLELWHRMFIDKTLKV